MYGRAGSPICNKLLRLAPLVRSAVFPGITRPELPRLTLRIAQRANQATKRLSITNAQSKFLHTQRAVRPDNPLNAWRLRYNETVKIYEAPDHTLFRVIAYSTGTLWLAVGINCLNMAYDKRLPSRMITLLYEGISLFTLFLAWRALTAPKRLIKELWLTRADKAGSRTMLRVVKRPWFPAFAEKRVVETPLDNVTINRRYSPTPGETLARDVRMLEAKAKKPFTIKAFSDDCANVYVWKIEGGGHSYVSVRRRSGIFGETHYKLDSRGDMAARDGVLGVEILALREGS